MRFAGRNQGRFFGAGPLTRSAVSDWKRGAVQGYVGPTGQTGTRWG
jgi:hypothetical protein